MLDCCVVVFVTFVFFAKISFFFLSIVGVVCVHFWIECMSFAMLAMRST